MSRFPHILGPLYLGICRGWIDNRLVMSISGAPCLGSAPLRYARVLVNVGRSSFRTGPTCRREDHLDRLSPSFMEIEHTWRSSTAGHFVARHSPSLFALIQNALSYRQRRSRHVKSISQLWVWKKCTVMRAFRDNRLRNWRDALMEEACLRSDDIMRRPGKKEQ